MMIFFLIIPSFLYLVFFAIFFSYLKRYGFQSKSGKKIMIFYSATSGLVLTAVIASYFSVEWENLESLLQEGVGGIFSQFSF